MESPVRICIGAALVVNILLLSGTTVNGNAIPHETTSTTVRDERAPRFTRLNSTWIPRSRPKTPDVSLNELNPKDSTSEEHTEKNAKYKDRGRIRYHSKERSSTESTLRRVKSTETPKLIIVTPTPEVKKPAEMVDRMRNFKKTKLPMLTIVQSTTPVVVKKEAEKHSLEEYEEEEDEEEKDSFEKFTSAKFDNFFTIPSFNYDEFNHESDSESSDNKVKNEYSNPSYGGFSSFFPREASYGYKDTTHDIFKSESFFDFDNENFDSDLTTPKNDFFDQKYQKISTSIIKNLDTIKAKATPSTNATNIQKIIKENVGLEKMSNSTPGNKSTVFIKNTKEIRLLDNDGASSANKELSDVQGTSIYYEMSVLSTETYAINHSEDDCDNEPLQSSAAPTPSTSEEEELASMKVNHIALPTATRPPLPDPSPESIAVSPSSYLPVSSVLTPISTTSLPVSIQNSISSTEKTKVFSSAYNRNRSYSKRLNFNSNKNSPNSVTKKPDTISTTINPRVSTRKFHHTTPKNKPTWLMPRRNITKVHHRPTMPTTIYSEHYSLKPINRTRLPSKNKLTTVSSEIDPVQQSEISGAKKVVHTQAINDNTVPGLWKRGSTRFTTSTATSAEVETESEWQIPPTSTAWALAGLLSPPPSQTVNKTGTPEKNVDENELQKVGETIEKPVTPIISTTSTTPNPINNDIIPKKIKVVGQKKHFAPIFTSPKTEIKTEAQTEVKSEKVTTESNVVQNIALPTQTNTESKTTTQTNTESSSENKTETSWVSVTAELKTTTESTIGTNSQFNAKIKTTKPTAFESITKLPADITTPQDESAAGSEFRQSVSVVQNKTTTVPDFEITTIRFSYVPTDEVETETESVETTVPSVWHAAYPTRTRITTIEDAPITTYRPKYMTTETTEEQESTTIITETSSPIEVSSQILENVTKTSIETTETSVETTVTTEAPTTTEVITQTTTPEITVEPTTVEVTTQYTTEPTVVTTQAATDAPTTEEIEDTTTVIVEVVTEINTERERRVTTTTLQPDSTELESTENSGSNEVITQETSKPAEPTTAKPTTLRPTIITSPKVIKTTVKQVESTTSKQEDITTFKNGKVQETVETTTDDYITRAYGVEDASIYDGNEVTTEASTRVMGEEDTGSGAAIAIAVSTIGVIALILLIGLLLVVRRRGRRGVYAQRCTPVSLDAYSLDSVSVGHRKGNQRLRASKRSYGNPAYDDEVTSHPMHYAALANFAQDIESMSTEFAEIPTVTVRPDEVPPGCEDKNRYSNVLPLPETRVPLKRIGNDPTTEYINANYVTGPGNIRNYYIACQAPLSNTVVDFWRMIWEQNSRVIVMLTEYMENGVEKCYEYLPPSEISDNKRTFGDFKIILKKREQRDKYAVSSVQLINMATRTWREITHLWYFWPAKGVPEDYDSVIDFICEMRSYMKLAQTAKEYDEDGVEVIYGDQNRSSYSNLSKLRSDEGSGNGVNVYSPARAEEQLRRAAPSNGTLGRMKAASEIEGIRPMVVTCASGAGRSGALVALDVCARAPPARADLPRAVRALRAQRPHALSNRHHYIFVYKVLSEYGNKMLGGGVDTI